MNIKKLFKNNKKTKVNFSYVYAGATLICLLTASYLFFVNKDIKNLLSVNKVGKTQQQYGNVPAELINTVSAAGNTELYNATWTPTECRYVAYGDKEFSKNIGVSKWVANYTVKGKKIEETWTASNWNTSEELGQATVGNKEWATCDTSKSKLLISKGDYTFSYAGGNVQWAGHVDDSAYLIVKHNKDTRTSIYSNTLSFLPNKVVSKYVDFGDKQYATIDTEYRGIESTSDFSNTIPKNCIELGLIQQTNGANKIWVVDGNMQDDGLVIFGVTDPASGGSPYSFTVECRSTIGYSKPTGWTVSAKQIF